LAYIAFDIGNNEGAGYYNPDGFFQDLSFFLVCSMKDRLD